MACIKISRVISVSSEDPKYSASNLLKSDISNCWKCENPGEKQVIVILQLERLCKIHTIHIGNENSAFIEILVGKSAVPDVYEVLRVTSLLMSVQDAKNGKNKNVVRFFEFEEFSKPIGNQSWDRIKIICTQPFNKYTQYGLSFIKVYSKLEETELKKKDDTLGKLCFKTEESENNSFLGKFALKKNEHHEDQFAVGSFFARRNDISSNVPTAASAIRAASNDPKNQISNASKRLSNALHDFKDSKRKRKNDQTPDDKTTNDCRRSITGPLLYVGNLSDEESDKNESTKNKNEQKKNEVTKNSPGKLLTKNPKNNTSAPTSKINSPKISSQKIISSNASKYDEQKILKEPKRKPFNRLLEDVIFVISGYQNPFRSELRSKALQMGAKYKADWDSTCTHLICAYINTPKFTQVQGSGWIVRKNWIEDCFALRKKLMSSSYKLDKNDTYSESDDNEIWEQLAQDENSNPPNLPSESGKKELNSNYSLNTTRTAAISQKTNSEDDIFEADTDIDSDYSDSVTQSNYETLTLKLLPKFFETKNFFLGTDLEKSTIKMLKRYIIAYKGNVLDDADNVNYIVSGDKKYKENVRDTPVVLPDWVWECNDQRTLIPIDDYLL